ADAPAHPYPQIRTSTSSSHVLTLFRLAILKSPSFIQESTGAVFFKTNYCYYPPAMVVESYGTETTRKFVSDRGDRHLDQRGGSCWPVPASLVPKPDATGKSARRKAVRTQTARHGADPAWRNRGRTCARCGGQRRPAAQRRLCGDRVGAGEAHHRP